MKIAINMDSRYTEMEITINCNRLNDDVETLIALIRIADIKLTGRKEGREHILDASNVVYIESIDKRTFLYTADGVYETTLKLYELEVKLIGCDFLRASKNCLININCIQSIKPDLDHRLILTLEKNITLIVSRQYSAAVKQKLETYHG
jgi:DNA-binding LytR/AlgR family response regulator